MLFYIRWSTPYLSAQVSGETYAVEDIGDSDAKGDSAVVRCSGGQEG